MEVKQTLLKKGIVDKQFKMWLSSIATDSGNYILNYLGFGDNVICRYDEALDKIVSTTGIATLDLSKDNYTYSLEKYDYDEIVMTMLKFYDEQWSTEVPWVSYEIQRLLPVYRPETEFENLLQ